MQCSITVERDRASGNKMKTNSYKNPYRKESNLDNIVDQLCTRLQDIKDQEKARVGMPTVSTEHSEAVRRYYAAFPALKKGQESPLQYYLPPPAWCRPLPSDMQCAHKEWGKKKERRNSAPHRRNRKRPPHRPDDALPEWVTHEGHWDMDSQDPVKEFIRAIALDEGYGTCENTQPDEPRLVPDWDQPDLPPDWLPDRLPAAPLADLPELPGRSPLEEELYAKFEAKFDRSLEALWAKETTPDLEYQDLPIDFQDLLSSPSDHLFASHTAAPAPAPAPPSSIWSSAGGAGAVDALHARLQPLHLADPPPPPPPPAPPAAPPAPPRELESFALYEGEEIYAALSTVASTMRSFTAINHSRDTSGFAEVPPRRGRAPAPPAAPPRAAPPPPPRPEREDLLTSARTHFRPIRREAEGEGARYADGDTFDIRGELEPVEQRRSESGGLYVGSERYYEYRADHTIDYTRLRLTAAQRCPDLDDPAFRLRFPARHTDAAVQTDPPPAAPRSPRAPAVTAAPAVTPVTPLTPAAAWRACDECGRTAKKKRPSAIQSIWASGGCSRCAAPPPSPPAAPPAPAPDELSREWEELLSDISAAHAEYLRAEVVEETLVSADRKRRHSAALQDAHAAPAAPLAPAPAPAGPAHCSHPHARFLHCCALALDRPLTR